MRKFKSLAATSLLAVMAVVGLAACGGESPAPATPTPSPVPPTATTEAATPTTAAAEQPTSATAEGTSGPLTGPVADLLRKAAEAMQGVKSYHGTLETSAGGVTAKGDFDFQAPDQMHMTLNTAAGTTEIIIIGNDSYAKAPGTNDYTQLPAGTMSGVNSGASPSQISALLNTAESGQVVGDEQIQGVDTTHIQFTYDQTKAISEMAIAAGQPTPTPNAALGDLGKATVDAWIEKSTSYIRQYKVAAESGAAGQTNTTLTLSKFNETVTPPIEKPSNVSTLPTVEVPAIPSVEVPSIEVPTIEIPTDRKSVV